MALGGSGLFLTFAVGGFRVYKKLHQQLATATDTVANFHLDRPLILLRLAWRDGATQLAFAARNTGNREAVHVRVDPLAVGKYSAHFGPVSDLPPDNSEHDVWITNYYRGADVADEPFRRSSDEDGDFNSFADLTVFIGTADHFWIADEYDRRKDEGLPTPPAGPVLEIPLTVRYGDVFGNQYQTRYTVKYQRSAKRSRIELSLKPVVNEPVSA